MKKLLIISILLILAALAIGLKVRGLSKDDGPLTAQISVGPILVSSVYQGVIGSQTVKTLASAFNGSATVVWLESEGSYVHSGDEVVRFDSSEIERTLVEIESELALAKCDMDSLEKAKLPLELEELAVQAVETRATLAMERGYLESSKDLQKEDLVSKEEVALQIAKVESVKRQLDNLELKLALTKKYLHPSSLTGAKATLASAMRRAELAETQLVRCSVKAPIDGIVIYKPLHISGEFRSIRVGDSIYRNQPFMVIGDMSNLIVTCSVPEAELSKVATGQAAAIEPIAYPALRLSGTVKTVSPMATHMPGKPQWQKYFQVVIGVGDSDPRLRMGMSAYVHILSYEKQDAVLIPRRAVRWDGNNPSCQVLYRGREEQREISVGMADETNYELHSGLVEGDVVLLGR